MVDLVVHLPLLLRPRKGEGANPLRSTRAEAGLRPRWLSLPGAAAHDSGANGELLIPVYYGRMLPYKMLVVAWLADAKSRVSIWGAIASVRQGKKTCLILLSGDGFDLPMSASRTCVCCLGSF